MDGDEIADVLFCGWDNEDRVFCVSGAGEIAGQQIWSRDTGSSNYTACVIDDVTGDAVPEVVVGRWSQSGHRNDDHRLTICDGSRKLLNCLDCGKFFSETKNTFLFNLKTPISKMATVLKAALLSFD